MWTNKSRTGFELRGGVIDCSFHFYDFGCNLQNHITFFRQTSEQNDQVGPIMTSYINYLKNTNASEMSSTSGWHLTVVREMKSTFLTLELLLGESFAEFKPG